MTSIATNALWTLAAARTQIGGLNDTSSDAFIQTAINGMSDAFERRTGRFLAFRDFSSAGERYDGNGRTELYLRAVPIRLVADVEFDIGGNVPTAGWNAAGNDLRSDSKRLSLVRMFGVWPIGRQTVLVKYTGGYDTVPDSPGTAPDTNWLPWDLHHSGLREIARVFYDQTRIRDGVASRSFQGESISYFDPGRLLKETRQLLFHYTRHHAGIDE